LTKERTPELLSRRESLALWGATTLLNVLTPTSLEAAISSMTEDAAAPLRPINLKLRFA
jgi:hypothetical protein